MENSENVINNNNNSETSSSDDDDDDDEGDNSAQISDRAKREIDWCGVDTETETPPPSLIYDSPSSSTAGETLNLLSMREGNLNYGNRMQLYCLTHYFVHIKDSKVRGSTDDNDPHTHIETVSAGAPGAIKLKGIETNSYIAMDNKGRLYAESNPVEKATVFLELVNGQYKMYLSQKYAHLGWYIGIKKSGRPKNGPKTKYNQRAIKFLKQRTKFPIFKPVMAAGKVRLKSQTQFYLEIKSNGMVVGSEDDSPDSILRLSGPPEQIRIQNVHNGLYLCFNATGRLYGERSMEHEGTLFKEISYNNLYLNYKAVDKDWYVSIRRDGILRSGPRSFNTEKNSRIEEREFLKLTIE